MKILPGRYAPLEKATKFQLRVVTAEKGVASTRSVTATIDTDEPVTAAQVLEEILEKFR